MTTTTTTETTRLSSTYVNEDGLIEVPASLMFVLDQKVNELAKIAKRYNLEAPSYRIVGHDIRMGIVEGVDVMVEYLTVKIIESPLVLDGGWTFVGIIEHTEHGNMIHITDVESGVVARDYIDSAPHCDHCGVRRDRNWTIIVKDEVGTIKRVGKACVKRYIPSWKLPLTNAMRDYLIMLENLRNVYHDIVHGVGGHRPKMDVVTMTSLAVMLIDRYGYQGKSSDSPTSSMARGIFMGLKDDDVRLAAKAIETVDLTAVKTVVEDVKRWIDAMYDDIQNLSDFDRNMVIAYKDGGEIRIGMICWAVEAWRRQVDAYIGAVKTEDKIVVEKTNCPIGRIEVTGEVVRMTLKYDQFLDRDIPKVTVRDDRGFTVYMTDVFANAGIDLMIGDVVTVRVNVKATSDRDPSMGFGNRPTCPKVVKTVDGRTIYREETRPTVAVDMDDNGDDL